MATIEERIKEILRHDVDEFVLVHFEYRGWRAWDQNGKCHSDGKGCVGEALSEMLRSIGAAEADFDCVEDNGDFYRYYRSYPEEE